MLRKIKKSRDFDFQSESVGISQSRNLHDHDISIGKIANNFRENKLSGSIKAQRIKYKFIKLSKTRSRPLRPERNRKREEGPVRAVSKSLEKREVRNEVSGSGGTQWQRQSFATAQ